MRKRRLFSALIFVIPAVLAVATIAVADDGKRNFGSASMNGYQEAPPISTVGSGSFEASLNGAGDAINYTLSYGDLEATVTQAHIHFGQRSVSGGIIAWLCEGTLTSPSESTPTCPPSTGGTVSGTITALEVIGPTAQGIAAAEFAELVRAVRAGAVYANVHTTKFGGGEIRGQVNDRDQRGDDDD
jgi:hypothetical protein